MNVARLLYIGAMKLGYTEAELFRMTPRKFFTIYNEFLELNHIGPKKKKKIASIDQMP